MSGIKQRVTKDQWADGIDNVLDTLDSTVNIMFELSKGYPIEISVDIAKNRRSSEQNALMWTLVRQINRNQCWGVTDENAKNILTAEAFGSKQVNGHEVYVSTSSLKAEQMSKLIDWLKWYCDDNGIPRTD